MKKLDGEVPEDPEENIDFEDEEETEFDFEPELLAKKKDLAHLLLGSKVNSTKSTKDRFFKIRSVVFFGFFENFLKATFDTVCWRPVHRKCFR